MSGKSLFEANKLFAEREPGFVPGGRGVEVPLIRLTKLTSGVRELFNIEQFANRRPDKLRSRSFLEAVRPRVIQTKFEGPPALDPRMDIPPNENTVVQPRQRRDSQFHAASLDVSAASADSTRA